MAARWPAYFVAFDVLQLDGQELLNLPYTVRRARLEDLFTDHALTAPWTPLRQPADRPTTCRRTVPRGRHRWVPAPASCPPQGGDALLLGRGPGCPVGALRALRTASPGAFGAFTGDAVRWRGPPFPGRLRRCLLLRPVWWEEQAGGGCSGAR
ncbi:MULTISPECIES: hypothetical protein [Streptomyces]|uniref:hypothetical protein n=1 Tax=Streptomyces TaxID=1883 RepID=UPI00099BA5C5|nr:MULTISPECIES: hypothetical protein [unclassified Streptomyces]